MEEFEEEIHIGKAIEARIEEQGMSKAEFGRRIDTSRQNVNTLLGRKSLDTLVLVKICKVLKFNFFSLYQPKVQQENAPLPRRPGMFILLELSDEDREDILRKLKG